MKTTRAFPLEILRRGTLHPDCHRPIAEDAAECPGCGATFVGEIAHENERLDREDGLT